MGIESKKKIDAIIVPTTALDKEGKPSEHAVELLKVVKNKINQLDPKIVLISGSHAFNNGGPVVVGDKKVKECEAFKSWLVDNGVDESEIVLENEATDSVGNAVFSRKKIDYKNFEDIKRKNPETIRNILVISTDFQKERIEKLYNWVFDSAKVKNNRGEIEKKYSVNYLGAETNLKKEVLEKRLKKEKKAIKNLEESILFSSSYAFALSWLEKFHSAYNGKGEPDSSKIDATY